MKNIHVLQTDKPSILIKDIWKNTFSLVENFDTSHTDFKAQHLYITSDEEIKEGDCFLEKAGRQFPIKWDGKEKLNFHCKKIILTTDQDLIDLGVQSIDDEFLQWYIKNPSCEEVEVEDYNSYGVDNWKYLITIPEEKQKQHLIDMMKADEELGLYEEPKQETLEEAAEKHLQKWRLLNNIHLSNVLHAERCKNDFIAGAKWQQERSYSEEEIENAFNAGFNYANDKSGNIPNFEDFIKQFKKK